MRVLFICKAGVNRSRTAAEFFAKLYAWETRYKGADNTCGNMVSSDDLQWSERLVVFERVNLVRIQAFLGGRVAHVLEIPDVYVHGDPVLVEKLRAEAGWLARELQPDPIDLVSGGDAETECI